MLYLIKNEYFYFASLLPVSSCSGSIGEGEVAGMAPEEESEKAGVRNGGGGKWLKRPVKLQELKPGSNRFFWIAFLVFYLSSWNHFATQNFKLHERRL